MNSSASSSSRHERIKRGIPTQCWCGKNVIIFVSQPKNLYRKFHMFHAKREELVNDVKDLRKSLMEHFEFQKIGSEKMEEQAIRIKMNEELIESYII
ncbi:hypothetical protein N665_0375s0025 [Sinapis alba]|nr:hypothetical protein N665_0375s0025 [Sinapis alba]